jgi:hypothetical protein
MRRTKMSKIKILIIGTICFSFIIGAFFVGRYKGRKYGRSNAFESIISEECWLNKQTRDIECIEFMGD